MGRAEGQHRMLGHKYGSAMEHYENNLISWGYHRIFHGTCTLYDGLCLNMLELSSIIPLLYNYPLVI